MLNLRTLFGLCIIATFCFISNIEAAVEYPFEGEIDFIKNTAYLSLDGGSDAGVEIKIKQIKPQIFNVKVDAEKIHTSLFDISTEVNATLEFMWLKDERFPVIKGNIKSQYTLLNQKPIRELSGNFMIQKERIELSKISFGQMKFQGEMGLKYPFTQDLSLTLVSMSLDQFLNFWNPHKTFDSEGLLSGEIKIKGDVTALNLRGNFESYDGFIKDLPFDNIRLNIAGIYPNMGISKSLLTQSGGLSYIFEGPFDLSTPKTFRKQIIELKTSPLVDASGSEKEWTIKRVEEKDETAIELKYFKTDKNRADLFGEDSEVGTLGIERSLKF